MSSLQAAKKFDFSNSFDANERGMVAARDFTLADLERAKKEAFEQGRLAGIQQQSETIDQSVAVAAEAIAARLHELGESIAQLRGESEAEAMEAVLAIAQKLVPHYVREHGTEEIAGIVRDCLGAVYDEPRVVIRAQDSVLDQLKGRLDELIAASGFGGKVVLFADPALSPHDCRIEWADGGTERNSQRLWQEIEATILRALGRDQDTSGTATP